MSDELDELLGDEEDEGSGGGNPDNNKRLSDALHRKEKEADALAKKLEKLEADMTKVAEERRGSLIAAAAKQLGIKDKHVSFYTGEPDVEALKQWAVDNEFIEAEGERTTEEKDR